jgi:type IV pilus assembly protein PilC
MVTFSYIAKKNSSDEIKGVRDAKDKFELAHVLRGEGYTVLSVEEMSVHGGGIFSSLFNRISVTDKMMFSRNVSVMIDAGVALARILDILSTQTKSVKFQNAIKALAEDIRKGKFLSEGMKAQPEVFSSLFVSMVKAGEEGGSLSEAFRLVGKQLEREHDLMSKVRGAMIYPSVIFTAMIVIGILMMIYVVPTLTSTFQDLDVQLPANTQLIINVSDFLVNNIILTIIGIAAAVFCGIWAARNPTGRAMIGAAALRLPVIKQIVFKMNAARTARTLGSLITSGVEIMKALEITEDVLQNPRYKAVIAEARENVRVGGALADVFRKHQDIYPTLVGEMMAVGEETGKLSEMLARLADFYEEEVSAATKDLSTIIEPVLMIFIGVAVGFFAVSMIQPLYSSLGNV